MPTTRPRLQATVACAVTLALWLWHRGPLSAALATIAALLGLLAWFAPSAHAPIQRQLDRFAHAILTVFTWLALGLVYFGVFTPMRLWRAVTRQDPLRLRPDPTAPTYLRALPPAPPRFDRQF